MPGRKANLFSKTMLQDWSIRSIIDRTVEFDCKVQNKEINTRDILRCDGLVKTLIALSGEKFNTKTCISDKLIDAVLSGDGKMIKRINKELESLCGYKYENVQDIIYYLTWFALSNEEPEFKTLKEYSGSLCA